jgi:hypothetical protein
MITIQDKIREIANAPVKDVGFGEDADKFFYDLCVKAYNLGIQTAADNYDTFISMDGYSRVEEIDRNSILKLKVI